MKAILLLNQDDNVNGANPLVTEIDNTLGFEVTFEKVSNGKYRTLQEFDSSITGFTSTPKYNYIDFKMWIDDENGDNTKRIYIQSDCNCDNFLTNQLVEIYVKDETEYNAFELSKLAHAQSILFGSGSEKLIALAVTIGAPIPPKRP